MLDGSPPTKPVIISITASTPTVLAEMVENIQGLRKKLRASYSASALGDFAPSSPGRTKRNSSSGASSSAPATHMPIAFVPSIDPATLVGIELNTSCPNIKDAPPPSYTFGFLLPYLDVLSSAFYADPSLTVGLKLPPYLYSTRFAEVVRFVHTYTRDVRPAAFVNGTTLEPAEPARSLNPFAYFACTNTLGNCLLFSDEAFPAPFPTADLADAQAERDAEMGMDTDEPLPRPISHPFLSPPSPPSSISGPPSPSSSHGTPPPVPPSPAAFSNTSHASTYQIPSPFALPPALGGLGGEALHPLALGNVYAFARLLAAHPDAAIRRIRVIGIGGVTSAAAAARMRAAGASVVGCATLLGREGVRAFEIIAGHTS